MLRCARAGSLTRARCTDGSERIATRKSGDASGETVPRQLGSEVRQWRTHLWAVWCVDCYSRNSAGRLCNAP